MGTLSSFVDVILLLIMIRPYSAALVEDYFCQVDISRSRHRSKGYKRDDGSDVGVR